MDLSEFLARNHTDLKTVVGAVQSKIGFGDENLLLAVGSLVEGIGNSKSDVDLWLIAAPQADPPRNSRDVAVVVGRCVVDVKIFALEQITELLHRLALWSRQAWSLSYAANFTLEERTILHRLVAAQMLHHSDRSPRLPRPTIEDLARLKLHVSRQMSRTIQVDMTGYLEDRDYHSLMYAAQEVLGYAIDALAAGYKFTNPLRKWRSRILQSIPNSWHAELFMRQTASSAVEYVWGLHRSPERADRKTSQHFALRILNFARAVFFWAELRLVYSADRSCDAYLREFQSNDEKMGLPALRLDLDFNVSGNRVVIGRLNDFSEVVSLPFAEFCLLLGSGEVVTNDSINFHKAAASNYSFAATLEQLRRIRLLHDDD